MSLAGFERYKLPAVARAGVDRRDAEIERLHNRIAELEDALGARDVLPMTGLPPQAARLLGVLLKREFVTWESARLIMAPDSISANYVSVYVCKLRRWLGEHRDLIQTRWGTGTFIAAKDKPKVRAWIAAQGVLK